MRKCKLLLLAAVLFAGNGVFAQIGINLAINRSNYMKYEHIYACVTLRNNSGRPLLFGRDPALQGFLTFDIRDKNNRPVAMRPNGGVSITGVMLAPGETRNVIVPLDQVYQLEKEGRYQVFASVSHNALANEYRSVYRSFRISEGVKVWTKTVGLPDITGTAKAGDVIPERTYSIHVLNEEEGSSYYLVVEDKQRVYGVCKLGQTVGYERFQAEVDMLSRIHLLLPIAPRIYHYLAFSTDGRTLGNSYWKTTDTIPSLHRDGKTGRVTRIGGVPARAGVDYIAPTAGKVRLSEILQSGSRQSPQAPRNDGMVDLGRGVLPAYEDANNEQK